jgi:CheY-like chemotaxis protein
VLTTARDITERRKLQAQLPERGSVFRVTLLSAQSERGAVSNSLAPLAPRGRVLVIDDDQTMGNAIQLVLGEDHEVDVLTSARSALDSLRAGASYDAIVCDVMMPEMSGVDFHSELMSTQPELAARIIFLSGGAFTSHTQESLDRLPNPCLDKPFDCDSLRALVSRQMSSRP